MAAPNPAVTVNFDIPMLAQLVQSTNDLRREVSDLRNQLSTRLDAIEARLATRDTNHSPWTVSSRDLNHEDFGAQAINSANQNGFVQDDHEDDLTQDQNLTNGNDVAYVSSPSVDEGLNILDHVSPPPAAGRKRKRAPKPAVAQRRQEVPKSSRSESPFNSNEDVQNSLDKLDTILPAIVNDMDETLNSVPEVTISQYGRPRKQAPRLPGFVETPTPRELVKMARQKK